MNPPGPGVPRGITKIRFPAGLFLMRVVTRASDESGYGKPWRPVFGWVDDEPMIRAGIDPASSIFRAFCRRHCIRDESTPFGLSRPKATARSSNPKAGPAVG